MKWITPSLNIIGLTRFGTEQLRELHVGQNYDIHWARHISCPSEEEYLQMVSKGVSVTSVKLKMTN